MNPALLAIPVVAVAVVAALVVVQTRHYSALFSEEHFREFHGAVAERIGTLTRGKQAGEAIHVTRSGLAAVLSCTPNGDETTLHVSLSQRGRPTTRAVGARFGFWVLTMLKQNIADLDPFVTESGVHHLVFVFQRRPIVTTDFAQCLASYQREYQEIPFRRAS